MKNTKVTIIVASTVIAVVAIIASVFACLLAIPVQQKKSNITSVVDHNYADSPAPVIASQGTVYTNTEFGFQIAFPISWNDKYKAVTLSPNEINFILPTSEAGWQKSIPTYPGYSLIFGVRAWSLVDWNKAVDDCKNGENADLCGQGYVGKTSQYVVSWFHPQDGPTDFSQYNVGGVEYLRANFKALK